MGRVIALDVGQRRIGMAVSDELGITAQGRDTWQRAGLRADLEHFRQLAGEYGPSAWVVGLPLNMNGSEGPQAGRIRKFGEALARHTRVPVEYWDERLTTVEANRVLRAAGAGLEESRGAVDRISAVLILQSFLERNPSASA